MTKLDRLGGILREVEAPLGRALREHTPLTGWLDDDLQLSYSQCGIATAALQAYLRETCSLATKRYISAPAVLTPEHQRDDPVRHVVLRTNDDRTICPTYTQFFELVGLSAQLAMQFPDMKALLPEPKIALFPTAEAARFGQSVAEHVLDVRATVRTALATRALNFYHGSPNLLEEADDASVVAAYQSIWSSNDKPFSVESQNNDQLEACVRNIVQGMT